MKRRSTPEYLLTPLGEEMQAAGKRFKLEPPFVVWRLRYRDAYGRLRRPQCDARTYQDALRLNMDREDEALAIREGRATPFQVSQMLWEELRDKWLAAHPHHEESAPLRSTLRVWFDPTWKRRPVASITTADCQALLGKAVKAGRQPATVRQLHIWGRIIFKYAVEVLEVVPSNPWAKVKRPKLAQKRPIFLRKEQVDALLLAAGPFRLLLLLAVFTGARRGELAALRWVDIDFRAGAHGVVYFRRSWRRDTTKGKKERTVPLHPVLREALLAAAKRSKDELLFPAPRRGGMRHTAWHTSELLRSIAKQAGVTLPEGCTFHSLRKTFGTHLVLRTGGDMTAAQRLLGHADQKTTDTYYVGDDLSYLEEAVAQLPAFGSQHSRDTDNGEGTGPTSHSNGKAQ